MTDESICTTIHAVVTNQIDNCNSLLAELPRRLVSKLQRVQNTAARLVCKLRKYDHISPTLKSLHWLPVEYRIEFKALLLVFKGLHGLAPRYIQEMLIHTNNCQYALRSNDAGFLKVPSFRHETLGGRAFAVYGPRTWNTLPSDLRLCDDVEAFKSGLKTLLFEKFIEEWKVEEKIKSMKESKVE